MTSTRLFPAVIATLFVGSICPEALAQTILDNELEVVHPLRPLDDRLRNQLSKWIDGRDAALSRDGKQTPEWWKVDDRLDPITVHGMSLLKYARDHQGQRA